MERDAVGEKWKDLSCRQMSVVFLGARGVGKTSIIKRFLYNESNEQQPRHADDDDRDGGVSDAVLPHGPNRYRSTIVSSQGIVDLHICDFPQLDKFPEDSLAEWNLFAQHYPFCRLRQASAYVLVYDATRPLTFQYVRLLREQILRSGADLYAKPFVVVANKQDLVVHPRRAGVTPARNANKGVSLFAAGAGDCINMVRKQWRCRHLECSAKYNWKVTQLFKEILSAVDGPKNHGSGFDGSRSAGNSVHHHLSHLPHIAQLAHLGNLAHLGQLNIPFTPTPFDRSDNSNSGSRFRRRLRRIQCPIS